MTRRYAAMEDIATPLSPFSRDWAGNNEGFMDIPMSDHLKFIERCSNI